MAQIDRVTGLVGNLGVKAPCNVATTTAITLSGEQTIDGYACTAADNGGMGTRVLVKDQANPIENGVYYCNATAWQRAPDFDGDRDVALGTRIFVAAGGVVNANTEFVITTANPVNIGVSNLTIVPYLPSSVSGLVGAAIHAAGSKATPVDTDEFGGTDSATGFPLAKFTWANIKATLLTTWKDVSGMFVGLTLYKINFKNAANTFTSFFTNANTAARTYTFQDKDGTIADLNDAAAAGLMAATAAVVPQDFRLTLTTGVPVTTADVTAAVTIFCTPYRGNKIALWNGSAFQSYSSAEFSVALGTLVSGKAYDVFCYQNGGVPTLEIGPAWTNDTTRATVLAYQSGILVKSGDATRRYLGTFYTTATTTTEDSIANRYLFNYYNRCDRVMRRKETAASWTYTTATFRQANGNTANQLNFIIGVQEDEVSAFLKGTVSNLSAAVTVINGLGIDSTSTVDTSSRWEIPGANYTISPSIEYRGTFLGRHFIAWIEYSAATGTSTWLGQDYSLLTGTVKG